ncbi:MAG: M28 family peptidase [Eubacteriales bacterium]|nr:M28 family peptidase [Eubacteriales bacterium]
MKITYGTMLAAAACMAAGLGLTGCAGPSTRVLPRESSGAYETPLDAIPVLEEANPFYLQEELGILTASQRSSGSRGESDAARYMQQLLKDYGYEVSRQRFRYGDPEGTFVTGTNVEAVRRAPSEEADILIVSTHHDSAAGSPGACESASGVVTWLETARLISRLPTDTEVRFVSVAGSESGWIGARHYVDSLTAKERARVIGCIEIDGLGYVSEEQIVLGTPDGRATMLGDMVKEAVWDVLGETWQYEVRQQKNYLAFTRGQIPSVNLGQAREPYEAGTPLDQPGTVDIERVAQVVNAMTQTVSEIMSTDTPSMLAKSRFMNDLRDDAYVRVRDEALGFGDTVKQTELHLGVSGREQSVNTDSSGRKLQCREYRMKWFDVDQLLLTDYYYVDGKLDTISIDGDGAGVEYEEMKGRLTSWYGEPDSESEGPSGIEYGWRDPVHRVKARLVPESDSYQVELQAYEPERQVLGTFVWDAASGCYGVSEEPEDPLTMQRMKILLDKVNDIYPEESAGKIDRILVCTDGIGAVDGYVDRIGADDEALSEDGGSHSQEDEAGENSQSSEDTGTAVWELGIDLEDVLTAEGKWRDETAADRLLVSLYGELLERENPDGIAEEYVRQFPSGPGEEAARAQTGVRPGEGTDADLGLPDFAESFTMFVLAGQPEDPMGDWSRRVQFFYGYRDMTAYRKLVRKNLQLQTLWMQEEFTAEEP